jgi:hypothetical protein
MHCPLKDPRRKQSFQDEGGESRTDRFNDGNLVNRCRNVRCPWASLRQLGERPRGCMLHLLCEEELDEVWTVLGCSAGTE